MRWAWLPALWLVLQLSLGLAQAQSLPQAQAQADDERSAALLAQWRLTPPERAAAVTALEQQLQVAGLLTEVPLHELLRSASSWKSCSAEPFALPPVERWPQVLRVLELLRVLRQRGLLGGFEVHSAYRDEALNTCAGGAAGSAHFKHFALDFTPQDAPAAAQALCGFWRSEGAAWQMGFGQYPSGRLHVDVMRYRTWGVGC